VLGKGAQVHQYAAPHELLAAPADDFVIGFVGPDRHVALLGLTPAADVSPRPLSLLPPEIDLAGLPRIDTSAPGATARWLLDAALATPAGYVVATDSADVALGIVHLDDVAAAGQQSDLQ
jgi:osmoprotectant transport system ATP-binding protein